MSCRFALYVVLIPTACLILTCHSTANTSLTSRQSFLDNIPDLVFTGDPNGPQQFGNHLYTGDVNGDGCDDLLVAGASRYNQSQGRVYLYYGGKNMDNNPDKIFDGENAGDYFGEDGFVGDINGDGYADIVIGAPGYGQFRGRVYVYYGGLDMDERPDLLLDGEAGTEGWFGWRMAVGDVNGDVYGDVFVGARKMNARKGRVYLYYGGSNMDDAYDQTFDGENAGDEFGYNVYAGGDVNGDSVGDVLISAEDYIGGSRLGRAYLYYGSSHLPMDAVCDKIFTGEGTGALERFGNVVVLSDIDRDGCADVIIGSPFWGTRAGGQGRAYLYWGAQNMDVIPDKTFTGMGDPDRDCLGTHAVCGDFNNDSYRDILIAAYNYYNMDFRGRAYIYYGNAKTEMDQQIDKVFTGPEVDLSFSDDCAAGDFNGDGYDDIAIGGPAYNKRQGRVWLYYNKPCASADEPTISLQEAVLAADIDVIQALVSQGTDVNAQEWGSLKTALHYAAENEQVDVAALLLAEGANVNAGDAYNATPLHRATVCSHKNVVELLLAKGASVNPKDSQGYTPLWYAQKKGHSEIIELLRKHGAKE